MNYKRKKSKRNVRCSMCTPHRWKGNGRERTRPSIRRYMQREKNGG